MKFRSSSSGWESRPVERLKRIRKAVLRGNGAPGIRFTGKRPQLCWAGLRYSCYFFGTSTLGGEVQWLPYPG